MILRIVWKKSSKIKCNRGEIRLVEGLMMIPTLDACSLKRQEIIPYILLGCHLGSFLQS